MSMTESAPARGRSLPRSVVEAGAMTIDRLAAFRIVYVAIFAFVLLYIATVEIAQATIETQFLRTITEAIRVDPADGPVVPQIQNRVRSATRKSPWVRVGGVRVNVFVLSADRRTPIYVAGRTIPPPRYTDSVSVFEEAERLLPASVDVKLSIPLDSVLAAGIMIFYGGLLVTGLFFYNRTVARREDALIESAVAARNAAAERADGIKLELDEVQQRFRTIEPSEQAHAEEIRALDRERAGLEQKLSALVSRETELRTKAARATELEEEQQTLEDLLQEAVDDMNQKDEEIRGLHDRLKRSSKAAPSKTRGGEQLARRLRTLYKNLEIDDRAISDIVALRDETMKLRAEEGLKRLSDDPETAAIRRKVGGLPPQLSIFELGFAGKGRLYYARGKQRGFRILAIGAKNTQNADMEYLSRLSL